MPDKFNQNYSTKNYRSSFKSNLQRLNGNFHVAFSNSFQSIVYSHLRTSEQRVESKVCDILLHYCSKPLQMIVLYKPGVFKGKKNFMISEKSIIMEKKRKFTFLGYFTKAV